MKNKIKGLLALALAAFTSLTWAAELVIPYSFDGKTGNTEYAYEYQVKMPSEALTSFTTTIRYSGGSHRVEILGVKLIDGETEYTAVATGTDGTEVADEGSYSGGNSYLNIFTFTNEEGFTANKVYTLQAMLKVTNNPPSHQGNIKISGGITLYVPPYSFGVNFTTGADQNISTMEGAGFTKGDYAKPIIWGNFIGSASGNGTMTVENQTIKVYWTARDKYNSGTDKSTDESKLLYGYLDDTVNNGRIKATVTITGLPSDKQYAVALILSGDGANNTDFNGKFSPVLINGQTYSYVDGALVSGDAAKADNAKKWGDRSMTAAAAGLAEGTNVMFVEGLSGSILTITSAMEAQNTSRLTIAGVQVWTTEDTPVAPTAPEDKEVVSLNFYSSQGSVSGEAGLVSAQGWENLGANGAETTLAVWNGEEVIDLPLSLTYSSANGHQHTNGVTDNYIKGYLDDGGNQAQVTVENIPFEEYSVIVYAATDTENKKFKPFLINDSYYAGVAIPTAYGYADLVLEGEKNLRIWGGSRNPVAAYGKNALRVDGLTASTLTIKGGSNGDGARGGIAAIQIINTGASLSDEYVIDWTAQPVDQVKVSALPELTKPSVKLKLADDAILEIDDAIVGHLIEIVGNNVTVNITKIELGKADVEAFVSGAASVTTSYTETLGYTKDGVTYPLIFRGTTDANWATLSNWYIGIRTQGETTYWIPYTKKVVPGAPNSNEWRATLVDGELMAIATGEDGYKTVTLPNTTHYEGWATKIAAYNDAHVVIGHANKYQSNAESGPGFLRVDDTSKITFQAYGDGNGDGDKSIYVNAENGVVFAGGTTSGIKNMTYYFDGDGSVAFATLNEAQTIAGLVLDLGTTAEGRKVVSRKLIGFTGGGATFTVPNGAVTTTAEDVTLETAEILQNVGQYRFEKKDDGYYVSYVAYAETDEIGAMNTWTATVDGNWNTAGNWSSGFVPAANADATIEISENTTITIPAEGITVGVLTVNGEGKLTIAGGKLTATKIFANVSITANENTLALAPMNIEAGKTVAYTIDTNGDQKVPALTGAGTFAKAGTGMLTMDKDSACDASITVNAGTLRFHEYAYDKTYNIVAKDGAKIQVGTWAGSLTSTSNTLKLEGGAMLQLNNGNAATGAIVKGTIVIDSTAEKPAVIKGNKNGNNGVIAATIKGNGVLEIQDDNDNYFTISGVISDGDAEGDVLAVKVVTDRGVTFTGANTYTGGTVVAEGVTVTVSNLTSIFGTGAITGAGTVKIAGGTYNGLSFAQYTDANTTIEIPADNTVTGYFNDGTWTCAAKIKLNGELKMTNGFGAGKYTFTGPWAGAGAISLSHTAPADVVRITGDISDFTGNISVAGARAITFCAERTADNQKYAGKICVHGDYAYTAKVNGTWSAPVVVENGAKIGGTGTIDNTLAFANGAIIDTSITATGDVTLNGTVTVSGEADATVLTCANAASLDLTKFAAPAGYKCVADGNTVKLAVDVVVVTPGESLTGLTEAEANAVVMQVTAPANVDQATYEGYFIKKVTQDDEAGTYTVSAVLNAAVVTPTIAGTTEGDTAKEAFVVNADGEGSVALNIANRKAGLHYAVQVKSAIDGDVYAVVPETNDGLVVSAEKIPGGGTAFFRVIVDFQTIDAVEPDSSENDGGEGGSEVEPD